MVKRNHETKKSYSRSASLSRLIVQSRMSLSASCNHESDSLGLSTATVYLGHLELAVEVEHRVEAVLVVLPRHANLNTVWLR